MCGSLRGNIEAMCERERLEKAIERLERRQWCEDATIALVAARKHLATLPRPPKTKTVWFAKWAEGECHRFDSREQALAYANRAPLDAFISVFHKEEFV